MNFPNVFIKRLLWVIIFGIFINVRLCAQNFKDDSLSFYPEVSYGLGFINKNAYPPETYQINNLNDINFNRQFIQKIYSWNFHGVINYKLLLIKLGTEQFITKYSQYVAYGYFSGNQYSYAYLTDTFSNFTHKLGGFQFSMGLAVPVYRAQKYLFGTQIYGTYVHSQSPDFKYQLPPPNSKSINDYISVGGNTYFPVNYISFSVAAIFKYKICHGHGILVSGLLFNQILITGIFDYQYNYPFPAPRYITASIGLQGIGNIIDHHCNR